MTPPLAFAGNDGRSAHRPLVSVVVLCFNYGHWLGSCVTSVLEQHNVDVEVIIVNDASSDDSRSVADGLAAQDRRVRVIHHERNRGQIASLNEALERVRGDYIVKMDADDMLSSGSLARSIELLEAHPSVGLVYGRAMHFGAQLDTLPRLHKWFRRKMLMITDAPQREKIDTRVSGWTVWSGADWIALMCERGVNCISQPEVVMRASTLRAVARYDAALAHTFDLAMWLRLASVADVGHINGAIQGLYRFHLTSLQRTLNAGRLLDLRGRLAAYETVLMASVEWLPRATHWLSVARRRLAREALSEACRAFDRGRTACEPVDGYQAFAVQAYPAAPSLREWALLERRKRIGVERSRYWPPFVFAAAARRAAEEFRAAHWWRHGI